VLSLGIFEKVSGLEGALEDVKKGNTNSYQNSVDLFEKVVG